MDKMERRARALEISAILLSRTFTAVNINTSNVPQRGEKVESTKEKADALFMIADLIEDDLARHSS